jgi:hypothetical protein
MYLAAVSPEAGRFQVRSLAELEPLDTGAAQKPGEEGAGAAGRP